jgi:hypothetical protein
MKYFRRFAMVSTALVLVAAAACQGDRASSGSEDTPPPPPTSELGLPTGWELRLDRPGEDPSGFEFTSREAGYHVRTGPAGILFNAALSVSDEFHAAATIVQTTPTQHGEAYGIFVGGNNLEGDTQSYLYFLIREDGKFLIKRRTGAETSSIQAWTEHAAIALRPEGGEAPANTLRIDAGSETVAFSINGEEVARLPRAEADVDGVVGLRVNHGLDLSITNFEVMPALPAETVKPESRSS